MVWHGSGKNSKEVQEMRFHQKNVLELPRQPKGGAGDEAWLGRTSLVRQKPRENEQSCLLKESEGKLVG